MPYVAKYNLPEEHGEQAFLELFYLLGTTDVMVDIVQDANHVTLTVSQMMALRDALNELFPDDKRKECLPAWTR